MSFLRWQKVFNFHPVKILKDFDANLNSIIKNITARTNPPLFHSEDDYQVEPAMRNQNGNEGMYVRVSLFTVESSGGMANYLNPPQSKINNVGYGHIFSCDKN